MAEGSGWISRRRLLAGLVTIGGASAAAGGGTMAIYADTESTQGNVVENDSLDLTFGDGGSTLGLAAVLNSGESTTGSVELQNVEGATGSLDVRVEYAENDSDTNNTDNRTAQEVAEQLTVTTLKYGSTNLLTDASQGLPSPCTLHDLSVNDIEGDEDLVNLADPGQGTTFTIELQLGNVNQGRGGYGGEGIDTWLTFTLNQTDAQ